MKTVYKVFFIFAALIGVATFLKASLPLVLSGTWAPVAPMSSARAGASAVLLEDGRILISGGDAGSGALTTADLFNTDGTISPAPPMHLARSHHSSVLLQDGHVLVVGGMTSGGGATNSAEIYDPGANSWILIGVMTEARLGATATLALDGRVVIAGGQNGSVASSTIEIFDPVMGTFNFAGTLSSPRQNHAAAVLADGRVLIVGGSNGSAPVASVDIYDPAVGSASTAANLNTPREGHSATTMLDGRVLVAGGSTVGNNGPVDLASGEIYDPTANTFTTTTSSLGTARQGQLAFLLPHNNSILITGGTSNGTAVASAELFIPWGGNNQSGVFQATGSMGAARRSATGSALGIDGLLLVAGGNDASLHALASTEMYGFATVKTDALDYPPGTNVHITGSGWQPGETVTLTMVESPLIDTHGPFTTVADSHGNISDSSFTTDVHDLDIRFHLTASGSVSQAQTTFTDANNPVLTVTVVGSGTITSSDNQISCPGTCSHTYSGNFSNIILTATPNTGSTFTGWSGAGGCTGTGTCIAFANGNNTFAATATFKTSTTTAVNSSTNPSTYGSLVTFTATVTRSGGSNTPTGTVTIKDGASTICTTGSLSGSASAPTASCATSTLTVNASPHSTTAVYGGDGNFAASTSTAISQVVNKAHLAVTADNQARAYGAANPTLTARISGFVNGETLGTSGVTGTASVTTTAVASSGVAGSPYAITPAVGSLAAANYDFTIFTPGNLTVTKAHLTVTANNQTRPYGAANPTLTSTISGFVNGETLGTSGVTGTASVTTTAVANSGVAGSPYAITPIVGTLTAANYDFTIFTPGSLTITKAHLTVIADDQARPYGATNPTLTARISGFVNGETLGTSGVSGTASVTTTAVANSGVAGSPYAITPAVGSLAAANYDFTIFTPGSLTITKAHLTVTADNQARAYGAANPTLTATISGFVNGETLGTSGVTGTASVTTTAVASSGVAGSPYAITPAAGSLTAANYDFTIFTSGSLTITKAHLTVTADNQARAYGAAKPDANGDDQRVS